MSDDIKVEILKYYPITPTNRPLPFVDSAVRSLQQVNEFKAGQPLVFLTHSALRAMEIHTQSQKDREVGGLLMGDFGTHSDVLFTWVEIALPANKAVGSAGGLSFTPDAILEIDKQRETQYPHLRSVGWYHSHPGFGIFLSGTDLNTHRTVFSEGPFVAIVLDPIHQTNGVFGWMEDNVAGPLAYWIARTQ